ncbi:MAG: cytochrome c oxidase subunit II [Geminocystis sp.]|nr:cytochrome c oxidase subunit II [Geminocystis sp.]HIK37061.1 cytochrome c oxidase subunit II [Geminocystis sp. M7585_C2015_104]MCS7148957.1 cytochrome c oxidase subunit II [Geminocystis sp.]MCX8077547.1 cytochrome c oxidase subunit II [Geminocystis sp.]MDW8117196.1 cytochrome c oxidase subunit II [Geminocystis sp.]
MNIPSNIITLLAGILLTLISLWYGQHHGLLPAAASEEAEAVDGLFNFMMTIATGLFLIVEGALVYCIVRFRRKKNDRTDGPPVEGNVPLEILWTAIPTIIVFILALYSFEVYNSLGGLDVDTSKDLPASRLEMAEGGNHEEAHHHHLVAFNPHGGHLALGIGSGKADLEVEVNAIQYAWIFTYPDTGIISGELHVPVNKLVRLKMKAGDVIHAFWVPQLRLKQDVIPGRESELSFKPTKIGHYPIICAELCGAYHGGMKTTLYVESEEDYQAWVERNLIAQTQDNPPMVFSPTSTHFQHLGITQDTLAQIPHLPPQSL